MGAAATAKLPWEIEDGVSMWSQRVWRTHNREQHRLEVRLRKQKECVHHRCDWLEDRRHGVDVQVSSHSSYLQALYGMSGKVIRRAGEVCRICHLGKIGKCVPNPSLVRTEIVGLLASDELQTYCRKIEPDRREPVHNHARWTGSWKASTSPPTSQSMLEGVSIRGTHP